MTDVTAEKKKWLQFFAKRYCGLDDPTRCMKESCKCSVFAEYRAFICKTVPEEFRNYSIRDFHGKMKDGSKMNPLIASRAKEQVFKYCWGDLPLDRLALTTDEQLNKASIIARRIQQGHNVVIHGNARKHLETIRTNGANGFAAEMEDAERKVIVEAKMGRTFIASILTLEALKLKADPKYRNLNYEWVQFSDLLQHIKHDGEEVIHYEGCNWLVVDDITEGAFRASGAQKAYTETLLDSFFSRRRASKLPTVLVFKFDVDSRRHEIESAFGVAINKIIHDNNTTLISLTQPDGEK